MRNNLKRQISGWCVGIGLGVMVVGCDMLDVEPTSVITSNSFWKTESDAEGALAGMYVQLRNNAVEICLSGERCGARRWSRRLLSGITI